MNQFSGKQRWLLRLAGVVSLAWLCFVWVRA